MASSAPAMAVGVVCPVCGSQRVWDEGQPVWEGWNAYMCMACHEQWEVKVDAKEAK